MPKNPFYLRKPWNMIIGCVLFAAMFIILSSMFGKWVLIVPPAWIAYVFLNIKIRRYWFLRSKGYFSGSRRRSAWLYEERDGNIIRSLSLPVEKTEPGHYELFFPRDAEWQHLVPDWAKSRRVEIAFRIAEGWKPRDFHLPDDLKAF